MPTPSRRSASLVVDKIRSLLAARGLSLAQVSRKSRSGRPYGPLHHIPHNLYDSIRKRRFTPSIYQVVALSLLSGYRFVDWLELFGISLDNVSRFQASFSAFRTVELDARTYHSGAGVPWFRDVAPPPFSAPLVPLNQFLLPAKFLRIDSLDPIGNSTFRFVKIGFQDAFAFPELLPGSIVRVKLLAATRSEIAANRSSKNLFLVEHGHGLVCSHIYRIPPNQVVLCSRHLPYASVELEQGREAAVLGIADVEIRSLLNIEKPLVPKSLGGYWRAISLPPELPAGNVGEFIRRARRRSGLSFREASKRTRLIAKSLHDARYFCAPGSLSDFETRQSAPRHIHKLISICAVYFANAADFLEAAGVWFKKFGALPMLPRLAGDSGQDSQLKTTRNTTSEFMREIERQFLELPYFLSGTLPNFFGMPDLSVRDVFWSGDVDQFTHPYMKGAAFLVVDRRKRISHSSLDCPKWAQPLYIFLRRDGSYLCGSYTRANGVLAIHPCMAGFPKLLRLRNRVDAEVVGQIVGVVRRLAR